MMHYPILEHITSIDTTNNRQSVVHHYGHFGKDLSNVPTPEAYLKLAQTLGRSAAREEQGTFVKPRGNGDLEVYVDTPFSRQYSHYQGIFMVVRSRGSYGVLATMFAPTNGKATFDNDKYRNLI